MTSLIAERSGHAAAIETLLDTAFGPDRWSRQSYAYRRHVAPLADLGRVALRDARVVGSIRYWPVSIGAAGIPALLLGPLAVDPLLRGGGLGRRLIETSLDAARARGHRLVLLVGDPVYYERFGFVPAADVGIVMPGEAPHRLRARALAPGALDGVSGPVWPWTRPDADRDRRRVAAAELAATG